jgi:hypothetical protein
LLLRPIEIFHGDIDTHLLRWLGIRPARRPKLGRQLEGHAGPVCYIADDDLVVVVLDADEAEELLVKHREAAPVRSVDYKAAPRPSHRRSMHRGRLNLA